MWKKKMQLLMARSVINMTSNCFILRDVSGAWGKWLRLSHLMNTM